MESLQESVDSVPQLSSASNSDLCPRCSVDLTSCNLARHARVHGLSLEQLWVEVHGRRPTCACGCGSPVSWVSWAHGFATVVRGHWSQEARVRLGRSQLLAYSEGRKSRAHWSSTRADPAGARINAARKTSAAVSAGLASGRIVHWSKSPARAATIEKLSRALKGRRPAASRRMLATEVRIRVEAALNERFTVVCGWDAAAERNSEHRLLLRCAVCGFERWRTVSNVLRAPGAHPRSCLRSERAIEVPTSAVQLKSCDSEVCSSR